MTTITGTAHFVNFTKACDYYRHQEEYSTPMELEKIVRGKLEEEEIYLGKPELEVGQRLILLDDGTRYGIEE